MNHDTSAIDQQRLFVTQYTAVFLIILTFIIGAFASPKDKRVTEPPQAIQVEHRGTGTLPAVEGPLAESASAGIGGIEIDNAFLTPMNNLNLDQLHGVVAVLRAHDIGARFSITVPASEAQSSDAAALVARMVSTYRWLETLDLPRRAYQVDGVVGEGPSLRVDFVAGVRE